MEGTPNPLAWLALFMVAPLSFYAFSRWRPLQAAFIVMFGGAMLLPCLIDFDPPLLPPLDKETLPPVCSLLACAILHPRALRARPFRGPESLVLVACVGLVFTAINNPDSLTYGPAVIPSLSAYSALSDCISYVMTWFPPFYLGRALVTNGRGLRLLLRYMAIAGVIYTIPILVELRLSPQLHRWVYGFHQHDFIQTIRLGGFRPMVFMRHGLVVAMFMSLTLLSAAGLYRAKVPLRPIATAGRTTALLLVILVLCKSTGAYFAVAVSLPVVLFLSPVIQIRLALGIAVLILSYPIARSMDWIPVDAITEWMTKVVNEERAKSLWFRLTTENEILERARERMTFGWGSSGRYHIYSPATGAQVSIIDGYWAIAFGSSGAVGWACLFGMMLWPIVAAARALKKIKSLQDRQLVAALALIVALYVFEWVPNSSVCAQFTFATGALAGVVPGILAEQGRNKPARAALPSRQLRRRPPWWKAQSHPPG